VSTVIWQTSRFELDLGQARVMGIVNLTPDSFSGDGLLSGPAQVRLALNQCERMVRDGADLLDIGAESSRPGAAPVSAEDEWARLLPVLRQALGLGVPISVDTCKPQVMQAALDLGADIINDIWALRQPGALEVVAAHPSCGLCLMHMHQQPQTMQVEPMQGQVVGTVRDFLVAQVQRVCAAGVDRQRVVIDPGIGFGKTVAQNFSLLAQQQAIVDLGLPVLAGWSRKSSIGAVLGEAGPAAPVDQRLPGSLAAAVLAVERGARVVRVHDVRETVQALRIWQASRMS
jgi:dihydropteroate synthase